MPTKNSQKWETFLYCKGRLGKQKGATGLQHNQNTEKQYQQGVPIKIYLQYGWTKILIKTTEKQNDKKAIYC